MKSYLQVVDGANEYIMDSGTRHGQFVWQPCDSIRNAHSVCDRGPRAIGAIVLKCGAEVETGNPMRSPRRACSGLVMNQDARANGCNRVLCEVESSAMKACVC